ncbi:hypothetical protein SEA_MAIH_62 [Streptomyces phage Maih]|uniref:Uncharacterized protein n=3 Tax=Woodruffvirus TP1604 TaxID=1982746 RepID=A0A0U4I9Q7_9CAUD|nr:hypothetical protein SEA_MAIH_62 [Streptomyces phage Maih]AWN08423.1 hypothetical protein SEA_BAYC_63 [Streptomyces phage BayC]AWN08493.1 hypothetical protein SEA_SALETE_63 [Streptomyces phage Salete]
MFEVIDSTGTARATITVKVKDAPALTATHQTRQFQPVHLIFTFEYRPEMFDGKTVHRWTPVAITARGPRILKPSPNGAPRYGVEELTHNPSSMTSHPEWLRQLAAELVPSGAVRMGWL